MKQTYFILIFVISTSCTSLQQSVQTTPDKIEPKKELVLEDAFSELGAEPEQIEVKEKKVYKKIKVQLPELIRSKSLLSKIDWSSGKEIVSLLSLWPEYRDENGGLASVNVDYIFNDSAIYISKKNRYRIGILIGDVDSISRQKVSCLQILNKLTKIYSMPSKSVEIPSSLGKISKSNEVLATWEIGNTGLKFNCHETHFLENATKFIMPTLLMTAKQDVKQLEDFLPLICSGESKLDSFESQPNQLDPFYIKVGPLREKVYYSDNQIFGQVKHWSDYSFTVAREDKETSLTFRVDRMTGVFNGEIMSKKDNFKVKSWETCKPGELEKLF